MGNQFLGEIRMFAGSYAPAGWALCQGQLMPISQNTALYSLLGTTYGGDGRSTFALPNMQGNTPMCAGQGAGLSSYPPGATGGTANVTLTTQQLATHTHALNAGTAQSDTPQPANNYFGAGSTRLTHLYASASASTPMAANIVAIAGGSQAHSNQQPALVLNFGIALQGIYPPRP